jgi:hypothetical protein
MNTHSRLKMSGILFVAIFSASLLGGAIMLMTPGATTAVAREDASGDCRMVPVPLDEGYSISRVEMRQVCGLDR